MTLLYWLLCLLIGFIPAYFIYRKDKKQNIPIRWLPAALRFLSFFLISCLLLIPSFFQQKNREEKPIIVWLQDNSISMSHALKGDSAIFKKNVEGILDDWKKDYQVDAWAFGSRMQNDSLFQYHQKTTDISGALQEILASYKDRNLGAIILSSDGNFNEGMNPLYVPINTSAAIYTVGLGDSTRPKDILVNRIYANKIVTYQSTFEISADLSAVKLNNQRAEVSLIHKGKVVAKTTVLINSDHFNTTIKFETAAQEKGFQNYTIAIGQVGNEENIQNNKKSVTVEVVENTVKVLIWANSPHPDIAAIQEALDAEERYKVKIKYGNEEPLKDEEFDMVIAHQIPSITGVAMPDLKGKPIWFILGQQSNFAAFNAAQSLLEVQNAGRANNVLPIFNKSFTAFTTPSTVQEVVSKLAPLEVPSGNFRAVGSHQILFTQQIGAVATPFPLWLMNSGSQPTAVLAGTGLWRWRIFEYKNFKSTQVTDELIQQTVNLLSVKKDDRPFKVYMNKYNYSDNEPISIFAELKNENGELTSEPKAVLTITDEEQKQMLYDFEKSGQKYEYNLGLLAPGTYKFRGSTTINNRKFESEGSFEITAVPLEYLKTYSDYEWMYQMANENNGKFYTLENMLNLSKDLKVASSMKPIIHTDKKAIYLIDFKWLFAIIFLSLAAEWLLRKYWGI